jgi:hypothetical protein
MLLTLWALTHRYGGFARDGQLYAMQAMAKLDRSLARDLYLQNTSQDQYTIFSPIYAALIKVIGLQAAELFLFFLCTTWFLAAAWLLSKKLSTAHAAWFSVVFLIVTIGYYGASHVFNFSENYLTARSLSEAMTVTALAIHFCERRVIAMLVGVISLLVHPLMALPGVLLLICLWLPIRIAAMFTVAGVVGVAVFAVTASVLPTSIHIAQIVDSTWLEVIRERAQFLFLKYWGFEDWENAARPFFCLTLTFLVIPELVIRRLCQSAMLVGASGIIVAEIAGTIGPVAILLQGQAWRWQWVTGFVSVLLVAPTAARLWKDDRCGPLCALLLILSWTYPGVDELACAGAALAMWLARPYISLHLARYVMWVTIAIGTVILVWIVATCWTFANAPVPESGMESLWLGRLREMFGLGVAAVLFTWLCWFVMRKIQSVWLISAIGTFFLLAAILTLPASLKCIQTDGTQAELRDFAEWRQAIPPSKNVLLLPPGNSASFEWFTLQRPSYLSVAQSAGVVFSRATSLEVRRRSEVLLPLVDPDWRILSANIRERAKKANTASMTGSASTASNNDGSRPLTADTLVRICSDHELGFVIAKSNVGFQPLRNVHSRKFKDWNLYDCSRVRLKAPAA